MTLVLALGNPDQLVQISDRLLVGPKGPNVLPANKATVLRLPAATFVCGFAGLASAGRFSTADWLLTSLRTAAPPDFQAGGTVERFVERANHDLNADPRVSQLAMRERRLSFMLTGYLYHHDPPLLAGALISNFQDWMTGRDAAEAGPEFRPMWITEKRPAPEPVPTYVQRIGMWPAIAQTDLDQVRRLLAERRPHEALVAKGVDLVRSISRRASAKGAVGEDLSSVTIFSDRSRQPVAGYHPANAQHRWYGVNEVIALGPDMQVTVKDLVVKAERPGPAVPPLSAPRPRRNDRCPCGSGIKYKRCCGR
jgi:SEC-C motif